MWTQPTRVVQQMMPECRHLFHSLVQNFSHAGCGDLEPSFASHGLQQVWEFQDNPPTHETTAALTE